jgi:tetratricopeptide (TPR) repeat protein
VFAKIWLGLVTTTLLGLFWIGTPYFLSAYYLDQGARLSSQGDYPAAIAALETALHFEPGSELASRWLAKTYLQLNEPEKALTPAQQALFLAPGNPLAQLELGDVYDHLGDVEQAIAHYEAGGRGNRQPAIVVNYLLLAERLWAGNDRAKAVAIWRDRILGTGYGDLYAGWQLARYSTDNKEAVEFYRNGVRFFQLKSITAPPDQRLEPYQVQAFLGAVEDGIWGREILQHVISYRIWQEGRTAESLLQSMAAKKPNDADLHFYLGEMYYNSGDSDRAAAAYHQALSIDPEYAPAYLQLGMLAEASCKLRTSSCKNLQEAVTWYEQYHKLAPDDLVGLMKLANLYNVLGEVEGQSIRPQETWREQVMQQGPAVVINQRLDSGWFFLGYRGDELRLVRGEPAPLWLFWQGPPGGIAGTETEGWYTLGQDRWVQFLEEAQNLVFNGGFELGLAGNSPSGFPDDIYRLDPDTRQLAIENHGQGDSTAALLVNTSVYSRSSFASIQIPIDSEALYLQTGWVKSKGGSAYVGRNWQWPGNIIPENVRPYSHIIYGAQPEYWRLYAGIAQPPPGTDRTQVWLLNYQATGSVYFDNVMLIKIGRPGRSNSP